MFFVYKLNIQKQIDFLEFFSFEWKAIQLQIIILNNNGKKFNNGYILHT